MEKLMAYDDNSSHNEESSPTKEVSSPTKDAIFRPADSRTLSLSLLGQDEVHTPLRGMPGRLRSHQGLAVYQVQGVPLLLPGVPGTELETNSQTRLHDGSFTSAVRAGGNGSRTSVENTAEDQSSQRRDVLHLPGRRREIVEAHAGVCVPRG